VWPYGAGLAPVMPEHVWSDLIPGTTRDGLYQMDGSVDVAGGPLELSSVSDSLVVSEANPGYPASGRPDVVSYHIFENEEAAIAALQSDQIDTFLSPKGLTAEQVGVLAPHSEITVQASPANGVRYLGFNLTRQPMADHAFRDALALVLDREELAVQTGTGGVAAYTFIGTANSRWQDETLAAAQTARYQESFPSRFAAAVAGLAEAGYSWESVPAIDESGSVAPGSELQIRGLKPAPLTILTSGDAYDPARPDYVDKIAETLGWFGFDVRPVETDFDSVVDLTFTPSDDGLIQYDMYLLGWTLGSPALPGYYRDLFATGGAMNNTGYSSGVFDGQLAEYEAATDQEQAHNSLWAMEKTLGIDLPYLLLYTSSINEAYRADRVAYGEIGVGGIQGRLGAIEVVKPVD
ncbi:MAG: ABC transporter substrate-binding protein, partial [Acidimicrobiia bacterium]